jgi:hypothetical protein
LLSNRRNFFNRDLLIKYLLLFFGCAAGITIAVELTVPGFFTTDTWWHLAVGKWMLVNHAIATYDPFSWSLPRAPWIAQEWLFQVLLYVAAKGGTYGVILFCAVPVLVTLYIVWKLAGQKANPFVAGLLLASSSFLLAPGLTARPQLFDFAFFAYILWSYKSGRQKLINLIPVVILIWANMHGAVILGVAVTLLYALLSHIPGFKLGGIVHIPGNKKDSWLVAGLSFVASLITPWGFKLYHYAFASVTEKSFQQYIQEWMAPPFEIPFIKSITLLAVILVVGGLLVSRKPVRLNTLLVCGGLFFQTLSQFRYFPLLGIAVAPLLGEMFRADEHSCNDGKLVAVGVVAGLLIGSLVGGMPSSLENVARGAGYPVSAVDHIKPGEKVLNPYNWGGYLIYRDVPVFIDSRADFYLWEGDVFKDYMESTTKLGFEELLIKYRPDAVLIGVDTVLINFMELLPGWEKTYQDGTAAIYRPSG